MGRKFLYVHDGYGNQPYIIEETAIPGEWQSLKNLGGEWTEIGELRLHDDAYINKKNEPVYVEATADVLSAYPVAQLAAMPGILLLSLPIPMATAITNEIAKLK